MKLHPSVPLALALAAGLTGTALAQTPASPSTGQPGAPQGTTANEANWNSQRPQSSYATQPSNYTQPQQAFGQPQQSYNPAQPATGAMQANEGLPNGQMRSASQPQQAQGAADSRVSQAQGQLQAAGLYNGPQDGLMDPDTRAAIAKFQEQHGLRRTEGLDEPTMAALMNNQTTGSGSSAQGMTAGAPNANQSQGQGQWQGAPPMGAGGNASGPPQTH